MTAVTAVFSTVELLEQVLLGVDSQTVLLAQRVNTTFRNVFGDTRLQKKLFLKPVSAVQEAEELGMVQDGCMALAEWDEGQPSNILISEKIILKEIDKLAFGNPMVLRAWSSQLMRVHRTRAHHHKFKLLRIRPYLPDPSRN